MIIQDSRIVQFKMVKLAYFSSLKRFFSSPSYFHQIGSEPLRPLTIGQLLDNAAQKWSERKAIESKHENISLTYSELRDRADSLAAGFLKLGLKKGDRIGALGTNSINWFLTLHAAAKAGLILAAVNPLYRPDELKYIFNKVGLKAVVTDLCFKDQHFYEMLAEITPNILKTPSGCRIKSKEMPELEYIIISSEQKLPGAFSFKDVENLTNNLNEYYDISKKIQPDEPGSIQYTSGTTGLPKAATLTHFAVVNNAHFFGKRCGLHKQHHTICLQVPFFHVFGSVLGVVAAVDHGSTLIIPGPYFSPDFTIKALKEEQFTAIYGTPTMYIDLCNRIKSKEDTDLKKNLTNFKVAVSGGALCTPQLFRNISSIFNTTNVQSAYGMSELGPITFTNTDTDSFEQRTETVGCVAEHTEVKVVDKNGIMVPFGTPGEVWFRAYPLMIGYWGDDDKTKECITPCRWMKSGDLMILYENGYGKVVGRLKEIINKSGENIPPIEIEEMLMKHPKILEAHVYGCSDERAGEEVCASIKLHKSQIMDEKEVREFCLNKIAKFKIPKHIRFVEDFPKTASGKVQKNVLKKMMDEELSASKG